MNDFCCTTDAQKLSNDLDLVIQQIDLLFSTDPHSLLGEPSYGSDYERFIWDLNVSNLQMKMYAKTQLSRWIDFLGFSFDVDVKVIRGVNSDIILMTIEMSRDGATYEKIYNFGG